MVRDASTWQDPGPDVAPSVLVFGRRRLEPADERAPDVHLAETPAAPGRPRLGLLAVGPAERPSFGYARLTMPTATQLERHLVCPDPGATSALGHALASAARPGDVICLWGELGAGKTHLAKSFGRGLGVTDTITSPSFILMAEYTGRLPLFHLDLYRLADAADALAGGLIDDRQAAGVTIVEWPDRLGPTLPARRLDVIIEGVGDEPRSITLRTADPDLRRYLDGLL
jgi:tRNA threonylcarbamoyladenosine biosynthesis protein TsaE